MFFVSTFLLALIGLALGDVIDGDMIIKKNTNVKDIGGNNNALLNEYAKHLNGNHGVLCLENACVGLAGNQKGFVELKKGIVLKNYFKNLPSDKHTAENNIACFNGACIGLNNNKPYMGYLMTKKTNEDVLKITNKNGFLCLEGACIHVMGNLDDTMKVMNNLNTNGVKVDMAKNVEICDETGCKDLTKELETFNAAHGLA